MILRAIFKRLFQIHELVLLLSLLALACLPIGLRGLVRDAGISLLLPLTLIGVLLTWLLTAWNVRMVFSGFALLILGPLVVYIRIGQAGDSLFEFFKQSVFFIFALFKRLLYKTPIDMFSFLSSRDEFLQKIFSLGGRFSLWLTSFINGIQIEDPVVRTLIWSMVLWLIAVWAGWQIFRNKRFLAGMLPSTVLFVLVLDYTGGGNTLLWLHLALLLFLFGLTNYKNLQVRWTSSHTDYAESTSFDTLVWVGVLTLGLLTASFIASTFSIKDILDDLREKSAGGNELRAEALGLEPVKNNAIRIGLGKGLPRSFLLSAGPELSTQLLMTISTGELPPMPQNARPTIPRHYWRTLTYSIYTSSGWTNPSILTQDIPADRVLIEASDPDDRIIQTQVIFHGADNERLYWTGNLVSVDVPFKAAWAHGSSLEGDLFAALASVESYQARSILKNISALELRESSSVYPDWVRDQFLALPDSVPERVLALARDLTASEPNPYDRALAIQNYLREFPYTLDVSTPPMGRDVTDYFLFDLKQGYCDYYATSMVVLARAAGLPGRLVVGYANGSYDLERAQYIVTENYAHSWVEIYFANIGWVEFEPTAGQYAILYEEINTPTASEQVPLVLKPDFMQRSMHFLEGALKNTWLFFPLFFSCLLLWMGFDSLHLVRVDPLRTIQIVYKRLRRLARPITGSASKDQTAHSFASSLVQRLSLVVASSRFRKWLMLSQHEIDQLTESYSRSLFAPLPLTRVEAHGAVHIWSRLRWRLMLANVLGIIYKISKFRK